MEIDHPAQTEKESSPLLTWGIIVGIATTFLCWGLLLFFVFGDKGSPDWDYSIIPDIPGESAYSTHSPFGPRGLAPGPQLVEPQHVMEPETEFQKEAPAK
ncbi:MAG: hypothetical protein ABFD97_26420 [Syntrophobacter sp.]